MLAQDDTDRHKRYERARERETAKKVTKSEREDLLAKRQTDRRCTTLLAVNLKIASEKVFLLLFQRAFQVGKREQKDEQLFAAHRLESEKERQTI